MKLVTKPTPFEKLLRSIKEYSTVKGLNKLYDNFGEDEQRKIEDAVVFMMNKYSKALIELQGQIPNSLYNKIDARWQATMKQDKEYIEFVLKNLQPKATEEIDEILAQAKSSFISKKRFTRMLIRETQLVHEETEQILKKLLDLIPDEEEEKLERLKEEHLLDDVNIDDFSPDEIVFANQPVDDELVNA